MKPDGTLASGGARLAKPTLFGRSTGRSLVVWDGHADLDGDGREECWVPLAEGRGTMHVFGGTPAADRTLDLAATNRGTAGDAHTWSRYAYVPNLLPADLDGDGKRELVGLRDRTLLAWSVAAPATQGAQPVFRLPLPFLEPEPGLGPEEMRTPRIQLADVNADGKADLLVSLLVGRRDKLGTLKTILFYYPGPFGDATTGLVTPAARLDTESVALHPVFVDLDGDKKLEYVGDSIRGTKGDLMARLLGRDPEITLVGFRYDGTNYARTPYFTVKRTYALSQAMSNAFGRSLHVEGDFDGDGLRDLLDLGNLSGVEILRGERLGKNRFTFRTPLMRRVPVKDGPRARRGPHGSQRGRTDRRRALVGALALPGGLAEDALMRLATRLALVCLLASQGAHAEPPRHAALSGPAYPGSLRLCDVDGDGAIDVFAIEARTVFGWRGRKGALPAAAPTWTTTLADDVTFVDALPGVKGEAPRLLVLGRDGARTVRLGDDASSARRLAERSLTWSDVNKATFADLAVAGGVLVPGSRGWHFVPGDGAASFAMDVPFDRYVIAPGPFLEDVCTVRIGRPTVVGGTSARDAKARALWTVSRRTLLAQSATERVTYDLSFLPRDGDQTLVDLDGDDRPEVIHRMTTNLTGRYGFFATRPATGAAGPSHQPVASDLFLSGFQLDPAYVDVDADGLRDFVVTTIEVNPANTLRALATGNVTAKTRVFLNRWREGKGSFFGGEADATIDSDVGILVRFNYAGTLEVKRSFTILVEGDYDGDGRLDLAIRTGPDALVLRPGTATGVWARKGRVLSIPAMGRHANLEGHTADVDGDGADEIVLVYRDAPGDAPDRIHVVKP